jgi:chromate transporter
MPKDAVMSEPSMGGSRRVSNPNGVRDSERHSGIISSGDLSSGEFLATFGQIGVLSFGGPAGQIALMHRMLVDEKRWIDEKRFLHALNYCMLLPGPEAMQLATYVGWMLKGVRGGLAAGLLFVLPGAIVVGLLSILYVQYRDVPGFDGVLLGIKAAVLAIVAQALVKIAGRALKGWMSLVFAGLAFAALFFFDVPFPLVILCAAIAGAWLMRASPTGKSGDALAEPRASARPASASPTTALPTAAPLTAASVAGHLIRTVALWGTLWALPLALVLLTLGPGHVLADLAQFFAKLAVVTFGGAYAVLAYMAQAAVETHGWLEPAEMVDGLGLAETTPGPLILVTQFVGFLAGYRFPDPFSPLTSALVAATLTTWMTFVPCFLWIFLGAPYVDRLRGVVILNAALAGITAAVVGVIAKLAVWFAMQVIFTRTGDVTLGPVQILVPDFASLNLVALMLTALASVLVFGLARGPVVVVGALGLAGAALGALALA